LAEKVFIRAEKARKLRDVSRSVKFPIEIRLVRLGLFCALATGSASARQGEGVSASAVVREMNLARQNPALYATYIEELRPRYDSDSVLLPGGTRWRMKEGLRAINEAVRFLRAAQPEGPLTLSPGMCRAAADHCADQAGGRTGHGGSDQSTPGTRLSHYGVWTGVWGENIAYGKTTAREIVRALIIDDGHPARPHRGNIFNPNFNYAGAACGAHARYGSVCTINFATGYLERAK
jgi:uncharacterized protein YkwD